MDYQCQSQRDTQSTLVVSMANSEHRTALAVLSTFVSSTPRHAHMAANSSFKPMPPLGTN